MALQLTVVTPEGQAYDGPAESVVLPGAHGEFAVLEQHERFLAPLKPGALAIHGGGNAVERRVVSSGFADVGPGQVVVLVDSCQAPGDVDRAAAEADRAEAEAALGELSQADEDDPARIAAAAKLELAQARLEVAGQA